MIENNSFKLKPNWWFEVYLRLPLKDHFHAIYPENNRTETIHLFSYSGKYYKIKMKDIKSKLKAGQFHELHSWTEAGKTVLPTKSKSVKNIGPKKGTPIEEMLKVLEDEMDGDYEDYNDGFKQIGYTELLQIIQAPDGTLKAFIDNDHHIRVIIDKALKL